MEIGGVYLGVLPQQRSHQRGVFFAVAGVVQRGPEAPSGYVDVGASLEEEVCHLGAVVAAGLEEEGSVEAAAHGFYVVAFIEEEFYLSQVSPPYRPAG